MYYNVSVVLQARKVIVFFKLARTKKQTTLQFQQIGANPQKVGRTRVRNC